MSGIHRNDDQRQEENEKQGVKDSDKSVLSPMSRQVVSERRRMFEKTTTATTTTTTTPSAVDKSEASLRQPQPRGRGRQRGGASDEGGRRGGGGGIKSRLNVEQCNKQDPHDDSAAAARLAGRRRAQDPTSPPRSGASSSSSSFRLANSGATTPNFVGWGSLKTTASSGSSSNSMRMPSNLAPPTAASTAATTTTASSLSSSLHHPNPAIGLVPSEDSSSVPGGVGYLLPTLLSSSSSAKWHDSPQGPPVAASMPATTTTTATATTGATTPVARTPERQRKYEASSVDDSVSSSSPMQSPTTPLFDAHAGATTGGSSSSCGTPFVDRTPAVANLQPATPTSNESHPESATFDHISAFPHFVHQKDEKGDVNGDDDEDYASPLPPLDFPPPAPTPPPPSADNPEDRNNAQRLFATSSQARSKFAVSRRQRYRSAHSERLAKSKEGQTSQTEVPNKGVLPSPPSLEPYVGKLERFELFSTAQCYYLVACDKAGLSYRVLRMDRTLIEHPLDSTAAEAAAAAAAASSSTNKNSASRAELHPSSDGSVASSTTGQASSTIRKVLSSDAEVGSSISIRKNSDVTAEQSSLPPQSDMPPQQQHQQQQQQQQSHSPNPMIRPLPDFCMEDATVYTQAEIREMLDMIHHGNGGGVELNYNNKKNSKKHPQQHKGSASGGGLKPIAKAYGIVGFVRFLDCYYLTLITRRAKVGSIGGNGIYTIKSTETFPIKPAERTGSLSSHSESGGNDPSSMLLSMWQRGKRSVGLGLTNREIAELRYQGLYQVVDLTKNFYFSYTYDITRSLQENFLAMSSQPFPPPPFKDMYAWNHYLTRELEECTSSLTSFHWVLPIIHGAFIERKLNDYGRSLNLTLIARRSRHFAGTRYLKRGVSDRGKVANDVEHEQILHDEATSAASGSFSSYLQVRGSIPTYWTQESSVTMPKPPIVLNRVDPTYRATQAHFDDLLTRYGSPIVVVDLVKQSEKREREVIVGDEYRHAIEYINCYIDDHYKVRYCALDYSHISKHRNLNVSTSLNETAMWAVNETGFFCSAPRWKILPGGAVEPFDDTDSFAAQLITQQLGVPVFPMEQKGVLRINCIDCIDRTNVAQFSAGVEAIAQQLVVMGIRNNAKLDPSSNIVRLLIDMYVEIGDHIAIQYGGSEAHKKVTTDGSSSSIPGPMGKHKELLTSIRRYYSNAFTDRLKQDAMNLFLGYYVPGRHSVPLWEMENDYYLHNFHVKGDRGSVRSMKHYKHLFAVDWSDEEDEDDDEDVASPTFSRKNQKKSPKDKTLSSKGDEKLSRIDRVRQRCNLQTEALSMWWRVAIHSYIQQRMWMQLGRGPLESLLPCRFERLYQPEKLSQFDKFFSRDWSTPMRPAHSTQHSPNSDDDTDVLHMHRKNVSPSKRFDDGYRQDIAARNAGQEEKDMDDEDEEEDDDDHPMTLGEYVNSYGFDTRTPPSMSHFVDAHLSQEEKEGFGRGGVKDGGNEGAAPHSTEFLGTLGNRIQPCDEYINYTSFSTPPESFTQTFNERARQEFEGCLRETTLHSDDVDGIRELAESAHIGSYIKTGPYRGLPQEASAVGVATSVQEYFDTLGSMRRRGQLSDHDTAQQPWPSPEVELGRRRINTPGVKESISLGWEHLARSEVAYSEIVDTSWFGWKRSDLTTASSMALYCSFFDDGTPLSQLQTTYMHGEALRDKKKSSASTTTTTTTAKIGKAEEKKGKAPLTTPKLPRKSQARQQSPETASSSKKVDPSADTSPLFPFTTQPSVPVGFEQINDGLFARKDNRFMVFNGVGMQSWVKSQEPLTKVKGIEEDILVLFA